MATNVMTVKLPFLNSRYRVTVEQVPGSGEGAASFTCPRCQRTSHHPMDGQLHGGEVCECGLGPSRDFDAG